MKNRELKKELINNGTFKDYREQRFKHFENKEYDILDNADAYFHNDTGESFNEIENKCCQELKVARKKQIQKIREHFTYWLNNDYQIIFGTFTFDDNKFIPKDKNGNIITDQIQLSLALKKRVLRTISPIFDDYIINIDFGTENERLHYHALIAIKRKNLNNDFSFIDVKRNKGTNEKPIWVKGKKLIHKQLLNYENDIGWFDMEPCEDNEQSAKKLSRYIDKLTLHSIKVKQNYVSVKKGTEYQQKKQIDKSISKQIKKEKRIQKSSEKIISTNTYLKGLRNINKKIKIETYVEQEYELLKQQKLEKEEKQKRLLRLKKERWNFNNVFPNSNV